MKTKLELEKIEKTDIALVNCVLSENQYLDKARIEVKLSCTHHAVRIVSDHVVGEMLHICKSLDTQKILEFVREMLKANKTLKSVKVI